MREAAEKGETRLAGRRGEGFTLGAGGRRRDRRTQGACCPVQRRTEHGPSAATLAGFHPERRLLVSPASVWTVGVTTCHNLGRPR